MHVANKHEDMNGNRGMFQGSNNMGFIQLRTPAAQGSVELLQESKIC